MSDRSMPATSPTRLLNASPAIRATHTEREILSALEACGESMRALAAALEIPLDRLARAEAIDRVEVETLLPVESLRTIDLATVQTWFETLGADLALDFFLYGEVPEEPAPVAFLRHDTHPAEMLAHFIDEASQTLERSGLDLYAQVRLAAGKSRLRELARALVDARDAPDEAQKLAEVTDIQAFYARAAWLRLLRIEALADWKRLGILAPDRRTVVVICDGAGYLAGNALEIIGARTESPPRARFLTASAWRHACMRARAARQIWASESGESGAVPDLALENLNVTNNGTGLSDISDRLAALHGALAALHLASAVTASKDGTYTLRFSGARPCFCELPAREDGTSPCDAIVSLAKWALTSDSADRLLIAREALARELPAGQQVTMGQIDRAARLAEDTARTNFALFLRRNSDQYFASRQQALDALAGYAAQVRKSVSELTADVVATAYRTVGLLAGVIIAGLIQPGLSLGIQRVAAALYSVYVLVFALAFVMSARWRQYQLDAADLRLRLDAMEELSARERERLLTQPAREHAYFETYFRWSCAIYGTLGLIGLLYFALLWSPLAVR